MKDEEPEPSKGGDYPIDDLEREAAGLPPLSDDLREKPKPPPLVHYASLMFGVVAALVVVGFGLLVADGPKIADELVDAFEQAKQAGDPVAAQRGVAPGDVRSGVPALLALLCAGGVMIALLILLFAYQARAGRRSARTVLAALVLIIAAFVIGMPGSFVNPVLIVAVVAGVAGLVLLFLPPVASYFPRLPRTARRWRG